MSDIEPKLNELCNEIKNINAFELRRKEFFDLFKNSSVTFDALMANIQGKSADFQPFITKEIKHIFALIAKNKQIDEIEDKFRNALQNFDLNELELLNKNCQERNLEIDQQLTNQFNQLYVEIAANPNYIAEKLAELKKTAKPGKPKK